MAAPEAADIGGRLPLVAHAAIRTVQSFVAIWIGGKDYGLFSYLAPCSLPAILGAGRSERIAEDRAALLEEGPPESGLEKSAEDEGLEMFIGGKEASFRPKRAFPLLHPQRIHD